jgi:hypothetical protein
MTSYCLCSVFADLFVAQRPPVPPQRPLHAQPQALRATICSAQSQGRRVNSLRSNSTQLCRSAAQPPDPEISALRGCDRRVQGALRGFRLGLFSTLVDLTAWKSNPVGDFVEIDRPRHFRRYDANSMSSIDPPNWIGLLYPTGRHGIPQFCGIYQTGCHKTTCPTCPRRF